MILRFLTQKSCRNGFFVVPLQSRSLLQPQG